jgi:DUF1707 SHOCT-like domain
VSESQHDPGTGGILPSVRIGTPERNAAVAALDTHWHAGRLDPGEHERRTTLAKAARTRTELDALFADLPDRVAPRLPAPGHEVVQGPAPAASAPARVEPSVPPLGGLVGRHRDTVMALTPFVALALFFLTSSWLWFLVIPVMGILLFGADDRKGRGRRRGC